jgi:hypothetical protein
MDMNDFVLGVINEIIEHKREKKIEPCVATQREVGIRVSKIVKRSLNELYKAQSISILGTNINGDKLIKSNEQ